QPLRRCRAVSPATPVPGGHLARSGAGPAVPGVTRWLWVISRSRPGWRAGDIRATDGRPPQQPAARPPSVHVPQKPPPTNRLSSRAPAESSRNRTVPAILATLVLIVASLCVRVSGFAQPGGVTGQGTVVPPAGEGRLIPGGQVCQVIGARGSGV